MLTLPEIPAPPERTNPAPVAAVFPSTFTAPITAEGMAALEAATLRKLDELAAERARIVREVARLGPPPSAERVAELEDLGYRLGLDREEASAPEPATLGEVAAFDRGWAAGKAEWDRRLDEMCGSADYLSAFSGTTDRDMYPHGGTT